MTAMRLLATFGGCALIALAFGWAMQVLTVKNANPPPLARLVFRGVRFFMYAIGNIALFRQRRQSIWALYVAVSLLAIVAIAVAQILIGYTLLFYGVSQDDLKTSYINSVSSLSVLGFGGLPSTLVQSTLALAEAFTGPIFVALLIAYLANLNSSVSQRQAELRSIEVKVGSANSGPELLERALAGPGASALTSVWQDWTREFVQARTVLPTVEGYLLAYSPGTHLRWVADAHTVLDAASLRNTVLAQPADPDADRCLVEGATTLRAMAATMDHALLRFHRARPQQGVTREQFDTVCATLAAIPVAIQADRDAAWQAFQQDRATYEDSLRRLSHMMDVSFSNWA